MPLANGIAIFGGTFDPIHYGHLRSAVEVREVLNVQTVRFVPSRIPPHRDAPQSTPLQRLEMLRLAVATEPGFEIDERELMREGKSYTVDTLHSIRTEIGDAVPLTFLVGFDAWCLLNEWHQWRRLLDYAHLAVLERPGYSDADLNDVMREFARPRMVEDPACLGARPCGSICRLHLTQMGIAATEIRQLIAAGKSPAFMMPPEVIEYIHRHGLYTAAA